MDSPTTSSDSDSPLFIAQPTAEFRSILMSITPPVKTSNQSSTFTDSDSWYSSLEGRRTITYTDSDVDFNDAVDSLRSIARPMNAAGRSRDCVAVYTSVRKSSLDERFNELGIERLSIKRLQWRIQQEKIHHWMRAAKVCVRVLFAAESALIKEIFGGLGTEIDDNSIADDCFATTVKDSAVTLFNFVHAISSGSKSPEKLFQILDLHQVLSELLPDIELIFASKSGEIIRKQAIESLSDLSETAREMLTEFEKAVFGELTKFPVPEGSVHPLTEYVMNYIHEIVEYKQILTDLIVTNPSLSDYIRSGRLDFDISEYEAPPLVLHLVWIIVLLKFKLQLKSKRYKQAASANLFIKNNVDYIVEEMRGSAELKELVGDAYHIRLISLAEASYGKPNRSKIWGCFECNCLRKIESFTHEDIATSKVHGLPQHHLQSDVVCFPNRQSPISNSMPFASPVAMDLLKEEFRSILISISPTVRNKLPSNQSSANVDSESSSWYDSTSEGTYTYTNPDVILNESVNVLRSIAGRMISAGQSRECIKVYAGVRKAIMEERLDVLKIERLSIKLVNRLYWKVQQEKIRHWIEAAKVCVRVLFDAEGALAKQIFDGDIADECFTITVNDSALRLFNFVDMISSGRKSPEKLFQILDLHQALSDLLPDIELIFSSESGELIRNQAVRLLSNLSETARAMLSEFEKAVFGELTKFTLPEGSVHPLTKYVMNYIHQMVEYRQILTQLIVSKPDCIGSGKLEFDFSEIDDQGQTPPLVLHVVWIIVVLKFKLQLKSKRYKQASSANLFIKNNVDYIVEEIRGSAELKELVGDDCHIRLITLAEANYQHPTWSKILDCYKCSCF